MTHVVPALPTIDTLKTGDRIRIGSKLYEVTAVVPPSEGWERIVELQSTTGARVTDYTLMPHRRKPGTFILSSNHQAREVSGWLAAPPKTGP